MWVKKINEFYDNMSQYDNPSLLLHIAIDLIEVLKERIRFAVDEGTLTITQLQYKEEEEEEIDSEGFLFWCQMTYHKELIDLVLSLRDKFTTIQNSSKQLIAEYKQKPNEETKTKLDTINKELEALKMMISRIETYRRNTFHVLKDKETVEKVLDHIRIYKERSE